MSNLPPISTNSYQSSAVDQFVATLGELGLVGEEIADVIWLALKIQSYEQPLLSRENDPNTRERKIDDKQRLVEPIDSREHTDPASLPDLSPPSLPPEPSQKKVEVFASGNQPDDKSGNGSRDLAIRLPDARSLQEPLTLARALRPLARRVSSAMMVLDEEATIERITEEQLWDPVLKPDLEPWLDLALVVDESKSMLLWRRTVQELQRVLKHYGIFRDVRTWGMVIEQATNRNGLSPVQVRIRPGIGKAGRNQRTHSPAELIDPQNRRLVLIATDCVASHWHDGTVLSALRIWAGSSSTAIIQMLPEWLWSRTALDLAARVRFRSLFPGIPNQWLQAKPLSPWDEIDFETGIQVPIVTLEPEVFMVWSQMVAGKGGIWAPGFVFEPELFEPDEEQEDSVDDVLSPEQRVKRFRNSASPMGWKLACLLASAPVINLPVVRIIQYKKLPRSKQVHVAEVFLGGLLRSSPLLSEVTLDTNPDSIQYIFADGVQEILLESARRDESVDVFQVVSDYITGRENTTPEEFVAYLRDPRLVQDGELQSHPIAQISARILKQLGGEFFCHAEQLENPTDDSHVDDSSTSEETVATHGLVGQENPEVLQALHQESLLWQQGKNIEQQSISHQSPVNYLAFSADGQLVASAHDDGKVCLSTLHGILVTTLGESHNKAWSIALSKDRKLLASGGNNKKIFLWEVSGDLVRILRTSQNVYSITFNSNSEFIVSGGKSAKIEIHQINGALVTTLESHREQVNCVVSSSDGKLLASCSDDHTIKIWNWETKQLIRTLEGHESWVNTIAFDPSDKFIISGSKDRTVRLWSVYGEPINNPFVGHTKAVSSVTFHPSGEMIASGSLDGTICLWNLEGVLLAEPLIAHHPHVKTITFSPDGKTLASGGSDGVVKLWQRDSSERTDIKQSDFINQQSLLEELKLVLALEEEQERSEGLANLLVRSPETSLNILQGLLSIENETERASALISLAPHLPHTLLPNALEIVRTIQNTLSRFQGLALLAARLPEIVPEALQVGLEIEDESILLRTLTTVVEEMPSELLPHALEAVLTIGDAFSRVWALIALMDRIPDATELALQETLEINRESSRVLVLGELVPRLPSNLLPRALEAAQSIQHEPHRFAALLILVNRLPEVIPIALEAVGSIQSELEEANAIQDDSSRVQALTALLVELPPEVLPRAVQVSREIDNVNFRVDMLIAITNNPHASDRVLLGRVVEDLISLASGSNDASRAALDLIQRIESEEDCTIYLIALYPHLEKTSLPLVIRVISRIRHEPARVECLKSLAPYLPYDLWNSVFELVKKIQEEYLVGELIRSMSTHLPEHLLQESFQIIQIFKEENTRIKVMRAIAPYLPKPLQAQAYLMIDDSDTRLGIGQITLKNISKAAQPDAFGRARWDWTILIETDSQTLLKIDYVEYTLHETYPDRVRKVYERRNKFALQSNGWAEFLVKVKVFFNNGSHIDLEHFLKLR